MCKLILIGCDKASSFTLKSLTGKVNLFFNLSVVNVLYVDEAGANTVSKDFVGVAIDQRIGHLELQRCYLPISAKRRLKA